MVSLSFLSLYIGQFFLALVFTCATETAVLYFFARNIFKISKEELPPKRLLFAGLFASFSTLPYVWFVLPVAFLGNRELTIALSETGAVIFEALFYRFILPLNFKRGFVLAFVCNAVSFLLGLLVMSPISVNIS